MRLLAIVLLFSYCLLASANQSYTDEADCDDKNVFQAADEVLKSFNDAKKEGNQFMLYRITEARKKEETGKLHIFISFEIQESVCPVKNGIYWQRCAFKVSDADYGECSAHVLVNTESKSWDIINQNCSTTKEENTQAQAPIQPVVEPIVQAVQYRQLGSYHVIDTTSEILLPVMQSAIEKVNREMNHQFHFGLENLTKAEQQVVSGWNYKLEYTIRQTNCSKSLFPKWIPEECPLDKNGQNGHCLTNLFVTPNEEIKDIYLTCESSTGVCLTCPEQVEKNDTELLNLLQKFIEEYNSKSNQANLYKFQEVQKASRKVFQNGHQYNVDFGIRETNCSKVDDILGEKCDIKEEGNNLVCQANINVANETVNIQPDYICNIPERIRLAIRGLSPLRRVTFLPGLQKRASRSTEKLKRKGNEPDHKEQKHGKKEHKDKKDKKDKNHKRDKGHKKHNGKDDHSSEESAEDQKNNPQVLPRPTQKAIPRVPEIDTNVLVTTTQKANPTSETKDSTLTQAPTPFIPNISHLLPLTTSVPQQGTYSNIHETDLLDLLSLEPEDVPKCPGKIWQPLLPILQIVTDKPFIIEGLPFHDDDLLLPEIEKQLPSLDLGGVLTDDDLDF
ncbi:T-kininogen 2-like isoform X1 [Ranitomeya variabilis]|uniref:T-kininogen 2-like isoform X1 n=1 Tax=Ranitomeya variabilis TaxID=490064 RepID=UPI004057C65F